MSSSRADRSPGPVDQRATMAFGTETERSSWIEARAHRPLAPPPLLNLPIITYTTSPSLKVEHLPAVFGTGQDALLGRSVGHGFRLPLLDYASVNGGSNDLASGGKQAWRRAEVARMCCACSARSAPCSDSNESGSTRIPNHLRTNSAFPKRKDTRSITSENPASSIHATTSG